jgi:hypothetical protein
MGVNIFVLITLISLNGGEIYVSPLRCILRNVVTQCKRTVFISTEEDPS